MIQREYTDQERELVRGTPKVVQQLLIDNNFDVFYAAALEGYEMSGFIKTFMLSDVAALMDFHLNYYRWHGKESIVPDFLDECDLTGIELQKTEEHKELRPVLAEKAGWVGYIYRLTHFKTGETSKEIVEFMPPDMMLRSYHYAHCVDPDGWIEDYYSNNNWDRYVKYFYRNQELSEEQPSLEK